MAAITVSHCSALAFALSSILSLSILIHQFSYFSSPTASLDSLHLALLPPLLTLSHHLTAWILIPNVLSIFNPSSSFKKHTILPSSVTHTLSLTCVPLLATYWLCFGLMHALVPFAHLHDHSKTHPPVSPKEIIHDFLSAFIGFLQTIVLLLAAFTTVTAARPPPTLTAHYDIEQALPSSAPPSPPSATPEMMQQQQQQPPVYAKYTIPSSERARERQAWISLWSGSRRSADDDIRAEMGFTRPSSELSSAGDNDHHDSHAEEPGMDLHEALHSPLILPRTALCVEPDHNVPRVWSL